MKRVLAKLMVFSMLIQALSTVCVQATPSNYYSGEELIYSENFDDWKNGNLLTEAQAVKDKYYMATPAEGKTVNIYSTATNTSSESVVAAVDAKSEGVSDAEHTGKVLKYLNNETSINHVMVKLGLDNKGDSLGDKVTVVEYDMYFAAAKDGQAINETALPALSYNADTYNGAQYSDSNFNVTNGNTFNGSSSPWGQRSNDKQYAVYNSISKPCVTDTWHKIKIVYTNVKNPSVDNPDTWRVYCDGVLLNGSLKYDGDKTLTDDVYDFMQNNYRYNDPNNGYNAATYPDKDKKNVFNNYTFSDTFNGLNIGNTGVNGSGRPIYFDNITVKTIEKTFDVDAVTVNRSSFNAATDNIVVNFTTPVDEETVGNIQVKDAEGAVIAGAVKTSELADAGTKLTLTLDSSKIPYGAKLGLVFPATFTDIYGQGLVRYYSATRSLAENKETNFYNADIPTSSAMTVELKTAKSGTVYTEDITGKYDFDNGTYSENVTFRNITSGKLPVWAVIVAFDREGAMLTCQMVENAFDVDANGSVTKSASFTVDEAQRADVATVKMFVWDGADTMLPYQDTVLVFDKSEN